MLLLFLVPSVRAEDFVCGSTTAVTNYFPSIDPSHVTNGSCSMVPESKIAAQRALLASVPFRYLKVVGGLAVEMTQAEKDVVDGPILAEEARQAAFVSEISTNDLCTGELSEIISRIASDQAAIQSEIDAVLIIATAKTALTTMNQKFAGALTKIAKCVRARAR